MSKGLLITGATGKQGGATIDALVSSPSNSSDFTILAVTRSPTSASAQSLTNKSPNIKIVQGDLNDVPGLFNTAKAIHPSVWGVFSVQIPMGKGQSPATEEAQGKALIDEALRSGVKHFVYTSVDRHGDVDSPKTPTSVPHFISKHNVEQHLISAAQGTEMSYTILRPVAFMENFAPGMLGKMFGAAWHAGLDPSRSLQLVSVADIGHFAAEAFRKPDVWRNRAVSLAGDDVTFAQVDQVFRERTGAGAPRTWDFLGSGLLWGFKEMGTMFEFFRQPGYKADVAGLKKEHPGLLSLGDWVETRSAWAKK